jgi:chromosomal replication initiation ATPase DnaA
MELAEFMDDHIKNFLNGNCTFIESLFAIAEHPNLKIQTYSEKCGTFLIKSVSCSTLTIENPRWFDTLKPENILKEVAKKLELSIFALQGKCRKRELTEGRQVYSLINMEIKDKKMTNYSLSDIGIPIKRHHTTVLHAKKVAHLPSIKQKIKLTNILQQL